MWENNMADGIPATFDPINNPIDALRLEFGDLDEYLSDGVSA